MNHARKTLGFAILVACACSKPESHAEGPSVGAEAFEDSDTADATVDASGRSAAEPGAGGTTTLEHKAGTYDPLHDRAPATGPGAAHVGDVPGMGLEPIDHPIPQAPRPVPTPPGVPHNQAR
jgi:hypothetical protein